MDLADKVINGWKILGRAENRGSKVYWICQCMTCGNTVECRGYELSKGRIQSCKVCSKSLLGQHFGEWEVIEDTGGDKVKCQCSCKAIKYIDRYELRRGNSKSCGHVRPKSFIDMKGKMIGDTEVLRYVGNSKWLCRCSCNREFIRDGYELRQGNAQCKSCTARIASLKSKETMMKKYGDRSIYHIYTPRSDEQIYALENSASMEEFIMRHELKGKRANKYAEELGISTAVVINYMHKFGLEEYIDLSNGTSHYEDEIQEILEKAGNTVQRNRRDVIGSEIDIYIPERNIGIEFNGDYFHSAKYKDKEYHVNKTLQAMKKGVRLVHIWEHEYLNNKDKIIQFLLDSTSEPERVTYGRKTQVKEIKSTYAEEICREYHLQGAVKSSVNIGCYVGDELLGVMTFNIPRFNSNYQWELTRLCWKSGIAVVGGTSKMFQYFTKRYKPDNIICYCDISKFRGDTYWRLGFRATVKDITEPNYIWVNSKDLSDTKNRYQTQKHKLVEAGLGKETDTENEIMEKLGYMKVYDCGNIRFTWERSR